MSFGQSRRQAFLDAVAPSYDDEPNLEPGLKFVQQLIADSKKAADLVDRALKATASIKAAKSATDELERAGRLPRLALTKPRPRLTGYTPHTRPRSLKNSS
jgi:hypothetical protein